MYCTKCRNMMQSVAGETDVYVKGSAVHVVNFPVYTCPECGRKLFHDILMRRAEAYASQFSEFGGVIDYGLCQNEEAKEIALMQPLDTL